MSGYAVGKRPYVKVCVAILILSGSIERGDNGILRRKPLPGILTIGIAAALLSTAVGVWALDLSFWGGLLLYSVSGMAATLFVAWRRVQCLDHHAARPNRAEASQ